MSSMSSMHLMSAITSVPSTQTPMLQENPILEETQLKNINNQQIDINVANEINRLIGNLLKILPKNEAFKQLLNNQLVFHHIHCILIACNQPGFNVSQKKDIISNKTEEYLKYYPSEIKSKNPLNLIYMLVFAFCYKKNIPPPMIMYDTFLTKYAYMIPSLDPVDSLFLCEFWVGLKIIMSYVPLPPSATEIPRFYLSIYEEFACVYENRSSGECYTIIEVQLRKEILMKETEEVFKGYADNLSKLNK